MAVVGILTFVLAGAALWYIAFLINAVRRLRHIPGPALSRITNIPRVLWVRRGLSHFEHSSLHGRYGDVVVYGPNNVMVSNPSALPTIYSTRPGFPKGDFYRTLMPFTTSGHALPLVFNTRDEELHKQMKSPIASLFSLTNVLAFEKHIDEVITIMCGEMNRRFASTGEICDLGEWLQFFAFEVMATMTFSARYGFLEQGRDSNGLIEAIWTFQKTAAPMTQIPWLDNVLYKNKWAAKFRSTTGNPILKLATQKIEDRRRRHCDETKTLASESEGGDMLDRFLEVQLANPAVPQFAPTSWTFSNLIAGSDSTATVLRTLWFNLLDEASSRKMLYDEIIAAQVSSPCPSWKEIADLPFLDACVQEAVRLHPPFCLPFERVCPPSGITVCGTFIPGGTNIGMSPYVVNRHQETFGSDADVWRPARWVECTSEERHMMESSILTFGFGRRVCLGKNIAVVEMKKLTVALLMQYRVELVDAASFTTENFWFWRQLGLKVKLRPNDDGHKY